MSETQRIAFLGFSAVEQSAISRILSVSGRHMPAHRVVDEITSATLVIVNGHSKQIVRFFLKLRQQQRAIVIGDDDHGSSLALCPRPIRVMSLIESITRALSSPIPVPTAYVPQSPDSVARIVDHTAMGTLNVEDLPLPEFMAEQISATPRPVAATTPPVVIPPSFLTKTVSSATQEPRIEVSARPPVAFVVPNTPPAPSAREVAIARAVPRPQVAPAAPTAMVATPTPPPQSRPQPSLQRVTPVSAPRPTPAPVLAAFVSTPVVTAMSPQSCDILIVDDSALASQSLLARLNRFELRADVAHSGEAALSMADRHDYTLIFLDVNMPNMDGYTVCRTFKRRNKSGAKPANVVMLTSRDGTVDKIRGKMVGCDGYLTKPLTDDALMQTLRRFAMLPDAPRDGSLQLAH